MFNKIHAQSRSSIENDDILDMMNVQTGEEQHRHHFHEQNLMEVGAYDAMNVDQLYVALKSTLNSA
jgi:hypothetical protein